MTQITNSQRKWHLIDLSQEVYGRALSRAASFLAGKNKPEYLPNLDQGDYVVMINADKLNITGNKLDQKIYYKHTGYLGNMKQMSLKKSLEKSASDTIKKSISGMLPKNKLLKDRVARLKIYEGQEHPHQNISFEE